MKILLVDTTSQHCYVALIVDNKVIDGTIMNCGTGHSEMLCTAVHNVMSKANVAFGEIDAYACGIGVGSFTGIRIGISTVLGYNRVTNSRLIALPNLQMLHMHSGKECVALDAGNGYYFARYSSNEEVVAPHIVDYNDSLVEDAYLFDQNVSYLTSAVTLARHKYNNGEFVDDLVPLYVRRSQAEINYDKNSH